MAAAQPRRIVSTTPSITETLYALGLGDRVVGVTNYCHYPPEVVKKPKIGTFTAPNLEAIAALRPDLVIIQGNPIQLGSKLAALHLKVLEINQDSLAQLLDSVNQIATEADVKARGVELTAKMRSGLDEISTKVKNSPRTRTMFLIGRSPNGLDGMVAAGGTTYLNELIQLAGGENIFKAAVAAYPQISLEEVLSRNPAVIIDMGDMAQTVGVTDQHKRGVVHLWSRYQTIEAVRKGRVFAVASDIFVVPGPRIVDAVREFARMLHPEAGL
jgi:iron complex transport system substrate-binding protein